MRGGEWGVDGGWAVFNCADGIGSVVGNVGQWGNDIDVVWHVGVNRVGSGHAAGGLGIVVHHSGGCGARGTVGIVYDVAKLVGV